MAATSESGYPPFYVHQIKTQINEESERAGRLTEWENEIAWKKREKKKKKGWGNTPGQLRRADMLT
jgi:hypothetical protein